MNSLTPSFQNLTPDRILNLIEKHTGERLTGLLAPLPSYINRVYEVQTFSETRLIAKFYRPGRWEKEAILEEHKFISDCHKDEIPVIPPLKLIDNSTLAEEDGMCFCLFPKKGGREMEFNTEDDWKRVGMLIGRMHQAASKNMAEKRIKLHPAESTVSDIKYLLENGDIPNNLHESLKTTAFNFIDVATPYFDKIKMSRIHGDCHFKNILYRPGEGMMLIDFDDMMTGPLVQDLWLFLPGPTSECAFELEILLEGYELFMDFDYSSLRIIESLRTMRMIYFLAWCCRQKHDNQFKKTFPEWGKPEFWRSEIRELTQQIAMALKKFEAY